jgi:anti-anti-sigma factor
MAVGAQTNLYESLADDLRIVVSQQGTTTTIALEGEWDLAQQEATRQAMHSALVRKPERVVLDLSRLTFLDSSGIYGVLELGRQTAEMNISFIVIPGPRAVQRLFEICQLSEVVPFADAGVS